MIIENKIRYLIEVFESETSFLPVLFETDA